MAPRGLQGRLHRVQARRRFVAGHQRAAEELVSRGVQQVLLGQVGEHVGIIGAGADAPQSAPFPRALPPCSSPSPPTTCPPPPSPTRRASTSNSPRCPSSPAARSIRSASGSCRRAGRPMVRWSSGSTATRLLRLQFEQRLLPGSVLRERVDELAQRLEQESGRKPGAKRRRELRDEALIDLLAAGLHASVQPAHLDRADAGAAGPRRHRHGAPRRRADGPDQGRSGPGAAAAADRREPGRLHEGLAAGRRGAGRLRHRPRGGAALERRAGRHRALRAPRPGWGRRAAAPGRRQGGAQAGAELEGSAGLRAGRERPTQQAQARRRRVRARWCGTQRAGPLRRRRAAADRRAVAAAAGASGAAPGWPCHRPSMWRAMCDTGTPVSCWRCM
jgi:hypothetical protein